MNYEITIVRKEPNPNFEEQLKEWKERERYNYGRGPSDYPQAEVIKNALICELTEEQFKAIKEVAFKSFQ